MLCLTEAPTGLRDAWGRIIAFTNSCNFQNEFDSTVGEFCYEG